MRLNFKKKYDLPSQFQVSSLTSSPDSSPSPLLGQITTNHNQTPNATVPGNNGATYSSTTTNTTIQNTITDSKLWMANSTTASPHSLSPKTFSFDNGTNPSSTADSGNNASETLRWVLQWGFGGTYWRLLLLSTQSLPYDPWIRTNCWRSRVAIITVLAPPKSNLQSVWSRPVRVDV